MQQTALPNEPATDWSVVPVALAFGLGLGALGWWLTLEDPVEGGPALAARVEAQPPAATAPRADAVSGKVVTEGASAPVLATAAASSPQSVPAVAATPPVPAAVQAIDDEFGVPVSSLPVQRPPFMNANEWDLISNALKQGTQTEEQGAEWVNNLRFQRLIKRWQALPLSAEVPSPRGRAAQLLLQEMRPRLAANGVDTPALRGHLPDILRDAIANPAERQQVAQSLAEAINEAQGAKPN